MLFPAEIILFIFLEIFSYQKDEIQLIGKRMLLFYYSFIVYRMLISVVTSGNVGLSIKKPLYYELGVMMMMCSIIRITSFSTLQKTFIGIGIVNAVLATYETFTRSSLFLKYISVESRQMITGVLGTEESRARTIFMHPIICGVFIVVVWCWLLYYPIRNKWVNLFVKVIVIIALLGTKSRSTWIAFLVVTVLYCIQRIRDKENLINIEGVLFFLVASAIMIGVIVCFHDFVMNGARIVWIRLIKALNVSEAGRYNRVQMIIIGLRDYVKWDYFSKFFGKGNGYALKLLKRYSIRGWNIAVDNSYLTMLLDYGIVGEFFLLDLVAISFRMFFEKNTITRMCGLGLLSIFISGFFFDLFSWFTSVFLIISLLCIGSVKGIENDLIIVEQGVFSYND